MAGQAPVLSESFLLGLGHVQELLLSLIEVPSLTPIQASASIPPLHRGEPTQLLV